MHYQFMEVLLLPAEGNESDAYPEFIVDDKPYFAVDAEQFFKVKIILYPDSDLTNQTEYVALIISIDGKSVGYAQILNIRRNVTSCIFDGFRKGDFEKRHMKFTPTTIKEDSSLSVKEQELISCCGAIQVSVVKVHRVGKRTISDRYVADQYPPDEVFVSNEVKFWKQPSISTTVEKENHSLGLSEWKFDITDPTPLLESTFFYHTESVMKILILQENETIELHNASCVRKRKVADSSAIESSMKDLELTKSVK